MTRRINMRHHIHVPAHLPFLIGRLLARPHADTSIGAKQINHTDFIFAIFNDAFYIHFHGHICGHGGAAKQRDGFLHIGFIYINRDDMGRPFGKKPFDQRAANAAARTGDDDIFPFNVHARFSPDCTC